MSLRRWRYLAVVAAMFALGAEAQQPPCEDALAQARKTYELGLFEDVPAQLAPCLGSRLSRAMTIQVRSLLALAYLESEEPEKARREVSTILRLDSTFEGTASPGLARLIDQVRREEQVTQVASVSKTNESLREAPATVAVITAGEIQRRGYRDLEQLLRDLPGFDLSRTNGDVYSYVHMRGYRAADSDRLLFLVDGVEQNEISTNTLFLSRQYPLSNIDRVEVVYGPASTMYGANAYTGVISIITRAPETFLGEKKRFALAGHLTAGGYGSGVVDVTGAGTSADGTIAWSATGNFQKSKERDLSRFPEWDSTYRDVDYADLLNLSGNDAMAFIAAGNCSEPPSPYFQCNPQEASVELTPAGVELVRSLDRALVEQNGLGFDDRAENWSFSGKVRISNLTLGLETWRSKEGTGPVLFAGSNSGSDSWTPRHTAVYLKYSFPLERVKLNLFTRYSQSSLERKNTGYSYLYNYATGPLSLWSLVPPCQSYLEGKPISCPAGGEVRRDLYGTLSNQFRSELNLAFEPSERLSGVAGLELAKSAIQSTFDVTRSPVPDDPAFATRPEQIEHTDVAVFAQGSYKPRPLLRLVLAGRLTYNQINNRPGSSGFGFLFTPRAGIIYSPFGKELVLKAIYSEAFKDPTDAQKFGTIHLINDFPGGLLKPEKVRNIELSAGWEPNPGLSLEASVYRAHYTNVVAFSTVPNCEEGCEQYQNRDENLIHGAQLTARYRRGRAEFWGNYTRSEAYQVDPRDRVGVDPLLDEHGHVVKKIVQADIARNRVNAGFDTEWLGRFSTGLRMHYVGRRPAGPETTSPDSSLDHVESHVTADAALTMRLSGEAAVQLLVENVADEQYREPYTYPGSFAPSAVPLAGRTIYLRLAHGWTFRNP